MTSFHTQSSALSTLLYLLTPYVSTGERNYYEYIVQVKPSLLIAKAGSYQLSAISNSEFIDAALLNRKTNYILLLRQSGKGTAKQEIGIGIITRIFLQGIVVRRIFR